MFASLAGMLLAASSAAEEPRGEGKWAKRRTAVVVGSSSVKSTFGRIIAAELERSGYEVERRGVVSAGLARPDFRDMRRVVESMRIDRHTAAVFVYLGTNDAQSIWLRPSERTADRKKWLRWNDPRWPEVYTLRARRFFEAICRRGAKRAIVMLPVEVAKPTLEHRLRRIRRLQSHAARASSCATAVSTSGEKGQFVVDGLHLRRADGVHMSPPGARLVWKRVKQRLKHLVEWAGPSARVAR